MHKNFPKICLFCELKTSNPCVIIYTSKEHNNLTKRKRERKMFEVGKTYTSRCFGDHELVEAWTIVKKTAKTITAKSDIGETKTVKIRIIEGCECAKMTDGFAYIRG